MMTMMIEISLLSLSMNLFIQLATDTEVCTDIDREYMNFKAKAKVKLSDICISWHCFLGIIYSKSHQHYTK